MQLPDLRALLQLPFDTHKETTGISSVANPKIVQQRFDETGLWWAVPFAYASGCHYAFRLSPGAGHGAVLRCLNGHAVTVASTPDRAIFAILACERLLVGEKSRARLIDDWMQVRSMLRDAVTITGGSADALDNVLHSADGLPKWVYPTATEEEEKRRRVLWRITGDESADSDAAWSRSRDSRSAPDDTEASLRLLQGNHGLDSTRSGGGLMPDPKGARQFLVACARRVRAAALAVDPAWTLVIDALATREKPEPTDFVPTSVGVGPERAWDGLAAASFWVNAAGGLVPSEHAAVAEKIADAAGAAHVLDARRIFE